MSEENKSDITQSDGKTTTEPDEKSVETNASSESQTSRKEKPKEEKKSVARRILKWVMRGFLGLLILIILLVVLIYLPPVQRFAINKASEMLSEELGMDVSVKEFSLGFPLDLDMGGVLAVQDGDTVVDARSLSLSVQLIPLFSGKVVIDNVELDDVNLNTKNLIDSFSLKGRLGNLSLSADDIDLSEEYATINKIRLRDTDLTLALADSVPEDTTVSEPLKWKFNLEDIQTDNVRFTVALAPQADSTSICLNIDHGDFVGNIDMFKSQYDFSKIKLENSSVAYRMGSDLDMNMGFDCLGLTAALNLDKGRYLLNSVQMDKPAMQKY